MAGARPAQGAFSIAPVADQAERRRRGLRKGRALLSVLDTLKVALLGHEDITDAAARLADLNGDPDEPVDPVLDNVMAHIKVRAAVELAKIEVRRAPFSKRPPA